MEGLQHLKLERTIGSGTFGKVKRAVHIPSGQAVAVKVLNRSKIVTRKDHQRIQREITILKRIAHPNLLKLLQLITTPKSIMLVTQLIEGEQLFQMINRKGRLEQEQAGELFVQVLDGVMHLKSKGIAHRDIKPENIIVEGSKVTLIDFGLGNLYDKGDKLSTSCGSHCYAAPQMMANKAYDPQKTQVWALGVTLYAMLSGKLPFQHDNPTQLHKLMINNTYEDIPQISQILRVLLRGMIETKPSKRLTLEQIKGNFWVKAMQGQSQPSAEMKWNQILLSEMVKELNMTKQDLQWRIQEEFGQQSISYHLRNHNITNELPFHSGPVHLKYLFKTIQLAKNNINSQNPSLKWISPHQAFTQSHSFTIKQIRGGFYYLLVEQP